MMITQEQVKALFDYDNGKLFRKSGKEAGSTRKDGYCFISVQYKNYGRHQLVFLYHHGYIPEMIDHINRTPGDDRIENLRETNHKLNALNMRAHKDSSTGIKGISYSRRDKSYRVRIPVDGRSKQIGQRKTLEEAIALLNEHTEGAY